MGKALVRVSEARNSKLQCCIITLVEKNNWTRLIRLTPFQKHHWNRFIIRIQSGKSILYPINKSVSMMFLKWSQSDQSVPIGSNYFLLQGKPFHLWTEANVTSWAPWNILRSFLQSLRLESHKGPFT